MLCRPEMVVGWYHSHPGFGCWLSGVDINTQQVWLILHMLTTPIRLLADALGMLPEPHECIRCMQRNGSLILQRLRFQGVLPCVAA